MANRKSGLFVVIEGIDGAGKDTQVGALRDSFLSMGRAVEIVSLIDYAGPLGLALKSSVESDVFNPFARQLLFSAERVRHKERLEETISSNELVLASRYSSSAYIYAITQNLPGDWARQLEISLPVPDISILLDLSPKDSLLRIGGGRDVIERNHLWLEKCRSKYLELAHSDRKWKIFSAMQNQEALTNEISSYLENFL